MLGQSRQLRKSPLRVFSNRSGVRRNLWPPEDGRSPVRQWAERGGKHKDPDREPRPRRRATYARPHGVRHLFAAYDLAKDKLYGHIKKTKNRVKFLEFCRYLRSLYPPDVRIAIVLDNFSPHLTTKKDTRVGDWAAMNNVEFAYTPTNSS